MSTPETAGTTDRPDDRDDRDDRATQGTGATEDAGTSADHDAAPADGRVGRLVVCATPIGNLEDVTARVLRTLAEAAVVACEDTRHTRRLLDRHGIRQRTVSLHEHNEAERSGELLDRVRAGEVVALVSDAGMPVVSDPGGRLVAAARDAGLPVEVLPGASAPVTAIATAGIVADRWRFVGFLPRRGDDVVALLAHPETSVAFESPNRLVATLRALAAIDPDRVVAVCRELTKLHEEVVRGPVAEVAARFGESGVRGEVTLVVAGVPEAAADDADRSVALDAVAELVEAGARAKSAARVVAGLTGQSANELYRALHERD
ncbi:16S rRNA (cytidine(1402)-2'-O)-methyltransferase [Patulibacter sp.]|uniref:16S rRNA (cytidine(1402)-2'-O)-methyltransferase n=1 Tax=Patulibacter sp. TaxID=1912859 RepID=UPI00271A4BA6|nr:16S rRNA (cytidine(1402)-2'-O)-methyltransferase [Patulibacter sp.]MDO9409225.1 16S rRNA (cytidine(1402)-2'-O)-methyltransferase [Patulibacter sp.]